MADIAFFHRRGSLLIVLTLLTLVAMAASSEDEPPFRGAYSDGDIEELQEFGFNATHVAAWSRAELDDLGHHGMRGIAWTGEWSRSSCRFEVSDEELRGWLADIRDHPALYAIQLSDEPRQAPSQDGCSNAIEAHKSRRRLVGAVAPDVPTFVTLDATQTDHYPAWKGAADIYGVVLYPCTRDDSRCDYDLISTEVNSAVQAGLTRLIGVVQAFGNSWAKMPSGDELDRMMTIWQSSGVDDYYYYAFAGYEPQGIRDTDDVHQTVRSWNDVDRPCRPVD